MRKVLVICYLCVNICRIVWNEGLDKKDISSVTLIKYKITEKIELQHVQKPFRTHFTTLAFIFSSAKETFHELCWSFVLLNKKYAQCPRTWWGHLIPNIIELNIVCNNWVNSKPLIPFAVTDLWPQIQVRSIDGGFSMTITHSLSLSSINVLALAIFRSI